MARTFLDDVEFTSRMSLGGPVTFGRNTTEVVMSVGQSGASATIDVAAGGMHTLTLNHDNCVLSFGDVDAEGEQGASFALIVTHSGDGRGITWPQNVEWPGTEGPELSPNDGDVDVFTFVSPNAGATWYGFGGAPGSTSSGVMLTGDQEISGVKTFEDVLSIAGNTAERVVDMGSSGSSATVDVSAGSIHLLSLNHESCSLTFSNVPAGESGKSFVLVLTHDGDDRGVEWPVNVNWPAGEEPILGHTSGDYDIFTFMSTDNGATWYGFGGGGNSGPGSWELIAGDGLSGGGDLTENRTLSVDSSVVRTGLTLTAGDGLTGGGDLTEGRSFSVDATVARSGLTLTAGDGLTGGGDLSDNRSFAVDSSVVRTSRTLTAGDGLTGGGSLTSNRSFSVDNTVVRTGGDQPIGGLKTFSSGLKSNGTINLVDAGDIALRFRKSYSLYAESTGAGSDNSRVWFDGPDNGEMVFGPRSGGSKLHQMRLRTNSLLIESDSIVAHGDIRLHKDIFRWHNNQATAISGGSATNVGANILMYGGAAPGDNASRGQIRADGTSIANWTSSGFHINRSANVVLTSANQEIGGNKTFNDTVTFNERMIPTVAMPSNFDQIFGNINQTGITTTRVAATNPSNGPGLYHSVFHVGAQHAMAWQLAVPYGSNVGIPRFRNRSDTSGFGAWRNFIMDAGNQNVGGNKTFTGTLDVTGTFILPVR